MNGKLKLNDLLNLTDEELYNTKIRLNTYNGVTNPIEDFKKDPNSLLAWNYWNNKTYRVGQISIGLVSMGNDKWLLFTVGKITKVLEHPIDINGKLRDCKDEIQVEFETLEKFKDLFGRVIVDYSNHSQQLFRNANGLIDKLIVKEVLPSVYSGFEFPGYDNVCLSYDELRTVVKGNHPSYRNALANQKAVYVLTDTKNGKLYIGSATSQRGMLLSRWTSYVVNGHGDNIELKEIVKSLGFDYIKSYFQYAIIENFNAKVDDEYVLKRERYWKRVFKTVQFGYNGNM